MPVELRRTTGDDDEMKSLGVQKRRISTKNNCKEEMKDNDPGRVGTMYIKVVEGILIRDTELIFGMNPFVTIEY